MKKLSFIVAGFCALAASAPAFAAPPPPIDMWSGWYAGGNIGASFGTLNETVTFGPANALFGSSSTQFNGVIGGAQAGYNWHVNPSWLVGLETDFQGSSEKASVSLSRTIIINDPAITFGLTDTEKLPWFGTVRGRIGWTPNAGALLYATGGFAYGGINSSDSLAVTGLAPTSASFTTVRVGWTVGTGVEVFLVPNWTAKVEYLFMDFGSFSNTFAGLGFVNPITVSAHLTDSIVRVGFNYHFF